MQDHAAPYVLAVLSGIAQVAPDLSLFQNVGFAGITCYLVYVLTSRVVVQLDTVGASNAKLGSQIDKLERTIDLLRQELQSEHKDKRDAN